MHNTFCSDSKKKLLDYNSKNKGHNTSNGRKKKQLYKKHEVFAKHYDLQKKLNDLHLAWNMLLILFNNKHSEMYHYLKCVQHIATDRQPKNIEEKCLFSVQVHLHVCSKFSWHVGTIWSVYWGARESW